MQQTLVKCSYNGKAQTVALFPDIQPDDLGDLLGTLFSIQGKVLGFQGDVRKLPLFFSWRL